MKFLAVALMLAVAAAQPVDQQAPAASEEDHASVAVDELHGTQEDYENVGAVDDPEEDDDSALSNDVEDPQNEYYYDEGEMVPLDETNDEDMDAAEAMAFRPLFRYRQRNARRRQRMMNRRRYYPY